MSDLNAPWPHCDARILHAPGECRFCDQRPDLQEVRKVWGIAFTGHAPVGVLPCPADVARPPGSPADHRRWAGNRPDDGDSMYRTVREAAEGLGLSPGPLLTKEQARIFTRAWMRDLWRNIKRVT